MSLLKTEEVFNPQHQKAENSNSIIQKCLQMQGGKVNLATHIEDRENPAEVGVDTKMLNSPSKAINFSALRDS